MTSVTNDADCADPGGLADLAALDRAGLARAWSDIFSEPVPARMSQPMQRRILAFEMQARRRGGLPPALWARLERLAEGVERRPGPRIQAGARLLREWGGITHVVDVTPDGYLWQGQDHRSLSAIARAITGARWSGPRFFGLQAAAAAVAAAAAGAPVEAKAAGVRAEQPTRPMTRPRASTPLATARATPSAMSRAARSPAGRSP